MRLPVPGLKNAKRLLLLLPAMLMLMLAVPAGPAAVSAAAAPTSTTPPPAGQAATTSPTTATGQSTTSSVAASTAPDPGAEAGVAAVVPPVAGLAPLNPGWKADQLVVQVWPEYDAKAVLVLMTFSLPADVPLPATFKFAIPTGATIAGIGEIDPKGTFKYNYADSYPPVQPGAGWDIVTIQVKDFRSLQIDYYYDPGLPAGAGKRSFPLLVQLPLDVSTLLLHVQQPARATDFTVQPALQGSGASGDGFTYAVATFSDVKAGSTLGQLISYSKPDGGLSAGQTGSTQAGESAPTQLGTSTVTLAAILVIVVIIGGLVAYRLYVNAVKGKKGGKRPNTQRTSTARPSRSPAAKPVGTLAPPMATSRKKSAAEARAAETEDDAPNGGEAVKNLCVACGEELTKKARFCPGCGEAQ